MRAATPPRPRPRARVHCCSRIHLPWLSSSCAMIYQGTVRAFTGPCRAREESAPLRAAPCPPGEAVRSLPDESAGHGMKWPNKQTYRVQAVRISKSGNRHVRQHPPIPVMPKANGHRPAPQRHRTEGGAYKRRSPTFHGPLLPPRGERSFPEFPADPYWPHPDRRRKRLRPDRAITKNQWCWRGRRTNDLSPFASSIRRGFRRLYLRGFFVMRTPCPACSSSAAGTRSPKPAEEWRHRAGARDSASPSALQIPRATGTAPTPAARNEHVSTRSRPRPRERVLVPGARKRENAHGREHQGGSGRRNGTCAGRSSQHPGPRRDR